MRKSLFAGWVLVTLSACGGGDEPADPVSAREEIAALLPALIDDGADSLDAADATQGMQDLRATMTSLENAFPDLPFDFPLAGDDGLLAKALAPQATEEERPGQAAARFLSENVFTDANHEGDGVFRIRGAAVCPDDEETGAPDPECVENVDAAELRLRVGRAAGGGLNITLLVGPDRDAPLVVRLRAGMIDVALDLAAAKAALQHLAFVVGEELDLPAVMRGVVAVTYTRHAARHVELAVAVRSAIEISGTMDGGSYAFTVAARDPLLSVELDVPASRFTGSLDVGALALRLPWSAMSPDSLAAGQWAFELARVTGDLVIDADGLALTGADLDLEVKLDDHVLWSVAVEAFALGIEAGDGQPVIELDPGLDVVVTVSLQPLADAGDDIEAWMLDERFTISVGPAVQPLAGAVRAVAGSIDVAATEAGASVGVAQGQCLLPSDVTDGEHPVIGQLAAGACP